MRYFIGHATTQYMGMEWGQDFVLKGRTEQSAHNKANKNYWRHGDGIEYPEGIHLKEVPEAHFQVLRLYLMELA